MTIPLAEAVYKLHQADGHLCYYLGFQVEYDPLPLPSYLPTLPKYGVQGTCLCISLSYAGDDSMKSSGILFPHLVGICKGLPTACQLVAGEAECRS